MADEAKNTKPDHYQQVAAMLWRRAELSTVPDAKAQISALAGMAESMAKLRYSQQRKAQNAPHGAAIEEAGVTFTADAGIVPPKKGEEELRRRLAVLEKDAEGGAPFRGIPCGSWATSKTPSSISRRPLRS